LANKKKEVTKKRPPKETSSPKNNGEILISSEEVYNVLEFANALYRGVYPGVFNPQLVNSRLKDITLSPQKATLDKINEALDDPKNSEQELIGYSQWLELNSLLYKRLLLYFAGLMSFDWTYVCSNIKDIKEYESPAYKKDLQVVQDFFDKLDVKDAFKIAMREMMRNEAFFGILRDDGKKYVIQELPQDRCEIVGRFDFGLLFDFDLMLFLQPGTSIEFYPPIFRKMYDEAFEDGRIKYNPTASLNSRTGSYVYWTQTSPVDGFVCFKLFPEIGARIPMLSPFMPDAVIQPLIRVLQMDSYIADASKIIAGQVPFLDNVKGANVKDSLALDPSTLGKFLALMKSALPNAIKTVAAPLDDIKGIEFKGNTDLYDSFLSTAAASSGINSRLLYSKDRQNTLETKISVHVDTNVLRPVYAQFSNMLEYWINQRTKKYKFKFNFEGFETGIDREERLKVATTMADSGIVLEQRFAAALGLSPFDFRRQLEETKANKFVDNLTPILKANQMSGDAGRPAKPDSELSEGGADTRADGTNDE
jgi:hypothetical protein